MQVLSHGNVRHASETTAIRAVHRGERYRLRNFVSPCRAGRGCTPRSWVSPCRGGIRRKQRSSLSASREGRGCTPRIYLSACREGSRCTPRSRISACREVRGCTPRSCISPCRADTGCTPHIGFSAFRAGIVSVPSRLVYVGITEITRASACAIVSSHPYTTAVSVASEESWEHDTRALHEVCV